MTFIVFVLTHKKLYYARETGVDWIEARSGPWGKGPLPAGAYLVEPPVTFDALPDSPYSDGKGFSWFARLHPQFKTDRSGFGIHPDGNVPGTKGCIGLVLEDSRPFYDWLGAAKGPINLMVV